MNVEYQRRMNRAIAKSSMWACCECDHKVGERYMSSGPLMQYTCALDGRKYGNVKSCPYRAVGGTVAPMEVSG